eukprot:Lithocolla_globosa_v1_NODE_726_length_3377_cov_3.806743.p2 type:complete len:214 gc:universal NODE_726_length_3377_cov_3.806743:735-94(-)
MWRLGLGRRFVSQTRKAASPKFLVPMPKARNDLDTGSEDIPLIDYVSEKFSSPKRTFQIGSRKTYNRSSSRQQFGVKEMGRNHLIVTLQQYGSLRTNINTSKDEKSQGSLLRDGLIAKKLRSLDQSLANEKLVARNHKLGQLTPRAEKDHLRNRKEYRKKENMVREEIKQLEADIGFQKMNALRSKVSGGIFKMRIKRDHEFRRRQKRSVKSK